eukprot:SAG31_NODE_12487_length_938_cov_0.831943_1_plen_64_part_10
MIAARWRRTGDGAAKTVTIRTLNRRVAALSQWTSDDDRASRTDFRNPASWYPLARSIGRRRVVL